MNPQPVSPTGHSAASHYLLAAISTHIPLDSVPAGAAIMQALKDSRTTPDSPGTVPVSLIVAGHEIPFAPTIEAMYERIIADLDAKVLERAKELLFESRLNPIHEALEQAQWKIEEALAQALKERA